MKPASDTIQLVPGTEIDRQRWDACLDRSANGLLYAYSFYLDRVAIRWDGLVLGDYAAIMPLTWNRKWAIHYLYQPFGCASLGVFAPALTPALVAAFLEAIPARYRYIDISLNSANPVAANFPGLRMRRNYTLSLSAPYPALEAGFSEHHRRNLRKAARQNLSLIQPAVKDTFALAQQTASSPVKAADYSRFETVYAYLEQAGCAQTHALASSDQEMLSAAIFFTWRNRAYYILAANSAAGKKSGASYTLVNTFIRNQAGSGMVLDFEGSDVPGVARFYAGFGALPETYPAIRQNHLPAMVRWMKP